MHRRRKIALIGAGQIGGTLALLCGLRNLGNVVLYDIVPDMPQGKALDLSHFAPIFGRDFYITGTNNIADIFGADLCIVTSGLPRKPGMSRDDLLKVNADIIRGLGQEIRRYAPDSFVMVITNPLDAMAYLMQKETGFPANRVVGMSGVLDTARYESFLAAELQVSVSSVSAFVLGGHGDSMVPIRSFTTCNGIPVEKLLKKERLDAIENRVRNAGGEVVALLKAGSAFYSPAAAAIRVAEAHLFDQRRVMAVAAELDGQYGLKDIYLGVPVIMGRNGVEKILEIDLDPAEKEAFQKSAEEVRKLIELL